MWKAVATFDYQGRDIALHADIWNGTDDLVSDMFTIMCKMTITVTTLLLDHIRVTIISH